MVVARVAAEERHPHLAERPAVGDPESEHPAVEIGHPVEIGHVHADMAHLESGSIRHPGFLSLAPTVHGFYLANRGAKDKGDGNAAPCADARGSGFGPESEKNLVKSVA